MAASLSTPGPEREGRKWEANEQCEAKTEEELVTTATDRSATRGPLSHAAPAPGPAASSGPSAPGPSIPSGLSALSDAELFARLRSDDGMRAREILVERYLPLARRLARRYQHTDEPVEDLVQVASIGLIKAVDRFDSSRDVMFSSYAVPTILGELKRHFRDRTWSVRVPRDLQELALRVDQTVTRLSLGRRRAPSIGEVALAVESSEERVLEAMEAMGAYRASSLDVPRAAREEEGESMAEALGTEDGGYRRAEERATLEPLMARISERERTVLGLRFGEDLTQAEIGERIGVSQMQVSRLIRQALTRLRASAETA